MHDARPQPSPRTNPMTAQGSSKTTSSEATPRTRVSGSRMAPKFIAGYRVGAVHDTPPLEPRSEAMLLRSQLREMPRGRVYDEGIRQIRTVQDSLRRGRGYYRGASTTSSAKPISRRNREGTLGQPKYESAWVRVKLNRTRVIAIK